MTRIPACGRRGCPELERHLHTGPADVGDRVVCVPRLIGSAGWLFSHPRGFVIGVAIAGNIAMRMVELDDGVKRPVHVDNLVRARLYRPKRKLAQRATQTRPGALDEDDAWQEIPLFGDP